MFKIFDNEGFTVDKLINCLELIKANTDATGNVKLLFSSDDIECTPTKLYYNSDADYIIVE